MPINLTKVAQRDKNTLRDELVSGSRVSLAWVYGAHGRGAGRSASPSLSLSGQVGNEPLWGVLSDCWHLTFIKGNTKDYFIYKLHGKHLRLLKETALLGNRSFARARTPTHARAHAHTRACTHAHAHTRTLTHARADTCARACAQGRTRIREKSRKCGLSLPCARRCANTSQALAAYSASSSVGQKLL